MTVTFRDRRLNLNKTVAILLALALSAVALSGCRVSAANPADTSSVIGPYSLVGWNDSARMRPDGANWSIELPTGGWWDFSGDAFDNGVTPDEATYRTSRSPQFGNQPYASVSVITLRSLENPTCPDYNTVTPEGESISERLADMQLSDHTARVYRVTAAAADGSASGNFNVCFVTGGVMYMIDAGARPTLAQVDLFKMLRTFRLDA